MTQEEKDNEEMQEFLSNINYMQRLYSRQKYSQAEKIRDELSEKLDDIMRINTDNINPQPPTP